MRIRMGELRCKEVINIADGSRYGYVEDAEIDLETGPRGCPGPGAGADLSLVGGAAIWGRYYFGGKWPRAYTGAQAQAAIKEKA